MNKSSPKKLTGRRRQQTAELLQQTHRLHALVAELVVSPNSTNVVRMNKILATEQPPSSVTSDVDIPKKIYLASVIGFPAMALVYLVERFSSHRAIRERFENEVQRIIASARKVRKGACKIVKLQHMLPANPHGYHQGKNNSGVIVESPKAAFLRHLRNSLAHGNYIWIPQTPTSPHRIRLVDYNPKASGDQRTFEAEMDLEILLEIVERMLIIAHKRL